MRNYSDEVEITRKKVRDYMRNYDIDFVTKYVEEECIKEYRKKLIGARLLLNNSFIFDETWDMEQCRIPYVNRDIDWNFTPNGDEEWIFMLNRHEYLNKLILAYYIEKDDIYIDKWSELVLNWIDFNDIKIEGGKTIRTIDTGIRCLSWLYGLIHLINLNKINDKELVKIILSIKEQLIYLKDAYIGKYVLSNWGVLQTSSIVTIYLLFSEFIKDENLFNWAIEELYKQINIQVFDDGSHWEQSIMYHVEVLNCSMKVIHMADMTGYKLDKSFKGKILAMAKYLMYCASPDMKQEAQGDSDRTDIRDVLVKAAALFNDSELKAKSYEKMDLSSIYILGYKYYDKFNNIKEVEVKDISKSFIDSGNIYIRSNFGKDGSFTYLQNGTLGSGHGHSDLGHFSIYYKGKAFLVDSGRYTYREDDYRREYLKSARAHNVSVIDDSPFAIPEKSWGYNLYGDTLKNYFIKKDNIYYAELSYLGEIDNGKPYVVIRKVLFISPGIWIIVNDIRCSGKHYCKNYYNFDDNVIINFNDGYVKCENDDKIIEVYNFKINEKQIQRSIISKNYNEINNNKNIQTKTYFDNKLINYDIILGQNEKEYMRVKDAKLRQFNADEEIDEEVAIVKEININENESYIIIIFNKETYKGGKIYFYKDIAIYGKVIVIHRKGRDIKVIRLRG